jgi:hypothetical protein
LHGDESGSVDRRHMVGSRLLEPDAERVMAERREMLQDPYVLDEAARQLVLGAIEALCIPWLESVGRARQVQPRACDRRGRDAAGENYERVQIVRVRLLWNDDPVGWV